MGAALPVVSDTNHRSGDAGGREGFALVEVVVAMMLLAMLAIVFLYALLASLGAYQVSKTRTLAQQVASRQLEEIRNLPYDQVGTTNGNPSGTVPASKVVAVDATGFTVATRISYVDDPLTNGPTTGANYKRVRITVFEGTGSRMLAAFDTQVAPPTNPGINKALIRAQVVDTGDNKPVYGATVGLRGPDLRTDMTEPDGTVNFAALTPNQTTGPNTHYQLDVAMNGYEVLREDRPPSTAARVQLSPGQIFTTALRVYRPASIDVQLVDGAGQPFLQPGTVTIGSGRGVQQFPWTGAPLHVTQVAGESVVPGIEYDVAASAPGGWFGTAVTQVVPRNYPIDLGSSFTISMEQSPTARVEVQVRDATSRNPIPNLRVDVKSGPRNVFVSGVANAGGIVTFDVPAGSGYTMVVPPAGIYAGAQTTSAVPGPGTTVVRLDVPRSTT